MSVLALAYPLALVLSALAAAAALYRIARGPALLDRIIAADVLIIIISSMVMMEMIRTGELAPTVIVLVASVIGFMGSVTVARFVLERSRIGRALPEDQH